MYSSCWSNIPRYVRYSNGPSHIPCFNLSSFGPFWYSWTFLFFGTQKSKMTSLHLSPCFTIYRFKVELPLFPLSMSILNYFLVKYFCITLKKSASSYDSQTGSLSLISGIAMIKWISRNIKLYIHPSITIHFTITAQMHIINAAIIRLILSQSMSVCKNENWRLIDLQVVKCWQVRVGNAQEVE